MLLEILLSTHVSVRHQGPFGHCLEHQWRKVTDISFPKCLTNYLHDISVKATKVIFLRLLPTSLFLTRFPLWCLRQMTFTPCSKPCAPWCALPRSGEEGSSFGALCFHPGRKRWGLGQHGATWWQPVLPTSRLLTASRDSMSHCSAPFSTQLVALQNSFPSFWVREPQ